MFEVPSIGYVRQIFSYASLKSLTVPYKPRSGVTEYVYAFRLTQNKVCSPPHNHENFNILLLDFSIL